jgi:hypothetical protein
MTNTHSKSPPNGDCRRSMLQLPTKANRISTSTNDSNIDEEMKKSLMNTIVGSLLNEKIQAKKHVLSKNTYIQVINKYKLLLPELTISMLKNRVYRLYKKHPLFKKYESCLGSKVFVPPPPANSRINDTGTDATHKPVGRPKGVTFESSKLDKINQAEAKDDITKQYYHELELLKTQKTSKNTTKKKTRDGLFNEIKHKVLKQRNLPLTMKFSYNTAMRRIARGNMEIDYSQHGPKSPLSEIEDDLVRLLILLGETGAPLTPPQVIRLTNSLIYETNIQHKLIKWKRQNKCQGSDEHLGRIGLKYYQNFMKRNRDRLRSKRGRRFELNRERWQTYTNFSKMYQDHEAEMIDAGIAEELPNAVWMDKKGNIVSDEKKSYGCKVHTKLTRPDMCIVMDEVGCNTSQLHDGHVGGTRFVVGKTSEARQLSTKKDKHFTCLGLTLLNGDALMCVVIVEGKQHNLLVEAGLDTEVEEITTAEDESEHDHFLNNMGTNKKYPGGPSCTYKNVEVPCMVEFTESGGITPKILTKIFKTLDALKIFETDRKNGFRPYVILDGHQSRFDIEFLNYMNDDRHRWSVVIGVPYGTALWQVGDSREQNGMFKVWITKQKEYLMRKRERTNMELEIVPTDIIPLICFAWNHSFAIKSTNVQAILERGWFPLNRALLLHPLLRASMTELDIEEENKLKLVPTSFYNQQHESTASCINPTIAPTTNSTLNNPVSTTVATTTSPTTADSQKQTTSTLNFSTGLSANVLDRLVSKSDLIASRKRNIESKREGECLEKRMLKMSRKSAAQLVTVAQTHVLGKPLRNRVRDDIVKLKMEQQETKVKQETQYRTICKLADEAFAKNKDKDGYSSWNIADLKTIIKPLKRKEDGAFPSHKKETLQLWCKVQNRVRAPFDTDLLPMVQEGLSDEEHSSNDVQPTNM